MCRTQCVLVLLALCLGLAHSFSWDIVAAADKRFTFYNNGKITFSKPNTPVGHIYWIIYDPVHNRLLYSTNNNYYFFLTSFDIKTKISKKFIKRTPHESIKKYAYDPVSEIIFASTGHSLYSFALKTEDDNEVNGTVVISLEKDNTKFREIAVDSCGKYIYWISDSYKIERARFDGTDREVIIDSNNVYRQCLTIERQKMYWIEYSGNKDYVYNVESADLVGNNRITLYSETNEKYLVPITLTVSKYFIYWANNEENYFWKLLKNLPHSIDVKPEQVLIIHNRPFQVMAANYEIQELNQMIQDCEALKSNIDSLNVSTEASLLCVHGTRVSGKSICKCTQGYTGERCDVSVCQNYCVRGDCSVSAEGQPKCRCTAGFSGDRCEVNVCYNYCLNNGVCSLNETSEPVCQCSEEFKGERCDLPVFLIKCVQTVTWLKDILKADVASVTLGKDVQSTCASTAV